MCPKLNFFSTYYPGDISKQIANDIKKIVCQSFPQIKLFIIFKAHSSIGGHLRLKDKQPQMIRSNVVYKYTCQCCKAFYIGKTDRQLGYLQTYGSLSTYWNAPFCMSPFWYFEYCQKCKVPVSQENFSIEDTLQSNFGLNILESLHQKTKKPLIGIQQQSVVHSSYEFWLILT